MKLKRTVLLSIFVLSVLFSTDYYTLSGTVTDPITGNCLDSVLLKLFTADSILQDSTLSDKGSYSLRMSVSSTDPLDTHTEFMLSAFPNPVNPSLQLSFTIPKSGYYTFESFDIRGRRLDSYNRYFDTGNYETRYGGANTASGMQLVRISGNGYSKTVKVTFLDGGNGLGFGMVENNYIKTNFSKEIEDVEIIIKAEKNGYNSFERRLTLTTGNNIYNIKMDKKNILKNNMLVATIKCISDSISNYRNAIIDLSDFSSYMFITPDSINAIKAIFSPDKNKVLISYDYSGLSAFCVYDIETGAIDYLFHKDYIFNKPISGKEPVWNLNSKGFYYSSDMRTEIYYYNLMSKEFNTIYHEPNISVYPIGMIGTDSILVFSNKYYLESHDNNCIFIMSPEGEYLSQIINPHLELINIGGINIKAAYDIEYKDSTESFLFVAYDSSSHDEFRIAVSNYDGFEYVEYTNSNIDRYPIFGPPENIFFDRTNESTGYSNIYLVNMNTKQMVNISEQLLISDMIYAFYPDY